MNIFLVIIIKKFFILVEFFVHEIKTKHIILEEKSFNLTCRFRDLVHNKQDQNRKNHGKKYGRSKKINSGKQEKFSKTGKQS